jgi:hypothetical protein
MAETTIINKFGRMTGWNSTTVNMMGRDIEGITSLKYDDETKKENVYGAGKYPVGRGEGNYEPSCSLGLLKEEMDGLQRSLAPGKRIQDIAPFDITVQYESASGQIMTDRIRNCEFTNKGVDVKNGDGSISTEYTLICSHIEWNVI